MQKYDGSHLWYQPCLYMGKYEFNPSNPNLWHELNHFKFTQCMKTRKPTCQTNLPRVFWNSPGSSPEKLISFCPLNLSSMLGHDLHAYSLSFTLLFLCSFATYLRYSLIYYQETNRCLTDGNLPAINCWETAHSEILSLPFLLLILIGIPDWW